MRIDIHPVNSQNVCGLLRGYMFISRPYIITACIIVTIEAFFLRHRHTIFKIIQGGKAGQPRSWLCFTTISPFAVYIPYILIKGIAVFQIPK